MGGSHKDHWEEVYRTKSVTDVSWYQPLPERSLELIAATGVPRAAPILDVGGGASTLADCLLNAGYTDVTVLDVAAAALDLARARLGDDAGRVAWIEADVTRLRPERRYAVWHDRAVFHFLTEPHDRKHYLAALDAALQPGGHLVLATFGPAGPRECSGLPVQRYSVEALDALLGAKFTRRQFHIDSHRTPAGAVQEFLYGWWQYGRSTRETRAGAA